MQSKVIAHLFTLALVCLGAASCGVKSANQTSTTPPAARSSQMPMAASTTQARLPQTSPTGRRPFELFQEEVRSYLYEEKFALLDSIASKVRANKERFPGGAWKLNAFYLGVGGPADEDAAPQSEWEMHLGKLRKWLSQSPNSITAHVGLGEALVNYAWNARGTGFSDTITPERGRLFDERSAMAEEVLNDARRLSEKCPHWYVPMLQIGLGQGWEPSRFNKVFDEAVALNPTYYYYYRVKAMYLLPRWYGQPGEWERFADEASRKVGGSEGAILYYLIASHIRSYYGTQFFEQNQVSWPRIKEGYASLEKTYGTDSERMADVCRLSVMAHEPIEACQRLASQPR